MRAVLGVGWSAFAAATTVLLLLVFRDLNAALAGAVFLGALLSGWTATATLAIAALKAREVVESEIGGSSR
jgi:hypothetical protein